MSKRHVAVSVSCLAVLSVSLAALIALVAHRMAQAQAPDGDDASTQAALSPPPDHPLARAFQPFAADDGALSYEELSSADKAAADRAQEWAETDHGHEVHQRWRQASREGRRLSELKQAEYDSGLAGLSGLGEN